MEQCLGLFAGNEDRGAVLYSNLFDLQWRGQVHPEEV